MPSASFTSSRSYVRRSRRKGANRIPLPSRTSSAEPCELPCQVPNQSVPGPVNAPSSSTAAPSTSGPGNLSSPAAVGSSNAVGGGAAPSSSSHHSPYDLRRKSPPHHDAAAAGTSSAACASYSASMLPARKRPRRTCSTTNEACSAPSAAHYLQYELPDEVLLTIFNYLLEKDLCRVSQVCKRFQAISNDTELWKSLFQRVYQYDLPLFLPSPCRFEFVSPEDSDHANPWKESFRQLYRGVHVRPGYQDLTFSGRSIAYFDTVQGALDYADERTRPDPAPVPLAGSRLDLSLHSHPTPSSQYSPIYHHHNQPRRHVNIFIWS